jgi:hypothetical protein
VNEEEDYGDTSYDAVDHDSDKVLWVCFDIHLLQLFHVRKFPNLI